MHWIVVLLLLAQALALAFFVAVEGWTVLQASLTVIGCVLGVAVTIIAGVLVFAPQQYRKELLQVMRDTIQDDLRDIARRMGMR